MPDITMPKLSDTMTEGTLVKWHKKKGDKVKSGDVIADVETDKATMEMEAFDDGIFEEIYIQEGQKVSVGGKLAFVRGEGESAPSAAAPEKKEAAPAKAESGKPASTPAASAPAAAAPVAPAPVVSSGGRVKASPLARKIAAKMGVDLSRISGTGPGGRIVKNDVLTAPAGGSAPQAVAQIVVPSGNGSRVLLSGMRRTIADRLLASKTQIPHFYLTIEINAEPLMKIRKNVNEVYEKQGLPKVTVNDFVVLSAARAVKMHPKVNAAFAGDSIITYPDINIAVAIAVEDGLVTPVVRNTDKLSLSELSAAVKDFAARARSKKLKPEEYQGGTLTISNLGAYGIESFMAIINPPQAMILAVGSIAKKPVVNDHDQIVVGHTMAITLSADHRVVDGAVGAEYLKTLRSLLENPALMLF